MATEATLKATLREGTRKGANRKLRATGRVPGVVYGHNEKTRHVSLDAHELAVLFSKISVENTVIKLTIEGEKGEVQALVREVQSNPVRGDVVHVDFLQLHAGEMVDV
jgi:large subunit ribosomal protein L25